ncbi:hypothetical protein EXIGLDRAFT_731421 [Exidia glandulosa HHB12029]|uniref:Uncharacterized protein n=1 Tax=Exidia glandulosa HHB12029 TaxID=1314781 RepID=A0A165BW65_EXIGL|nr:hypothetical protein EXIGLDRAFT_731421 [Exidia glandulosa HHB12029]
MVDPGNNSTSLNSTGAHMTWSMENYIRRCLEPGPYTHVTSRTGRTWNRPAAGSGSPLVNNLCSPWDYGILGSSSESPE